MPQTRLANRKTSKVPQMLKSKISKTSISGAATSA
jgi:hypothetical protein